MYCHSIYQEFKIKNIVVIFRTIFRWITVKNLNTMQFDENLRGDTPMGLLRGIKHGTESYHVLFKRLCRLVKIIIYNIKCKVPLFN